MAAEKDPVKYFKSEIKRLNYYNSQFLKEDDFLDEQLYHNQMRYLHNRALHTWGVVEGLEVKQITGTGTVKVGAGIAIDRLGREIVLPAPTDAIALDAYAASARVYVTIKYGEVFDQADKDTQSTSKLYTRTTERPEVNTTATAPADDAPEVVLAVVVLDKDKAIAQVDTALRRYSASRFGSSADGKEFSLYADSAGAWHFYDGAKGADRLTVDGNGNVGIGRSTVGAKLDVNGEVRSQMLRIADGDGVVYPDNWIGMANNIDGTSKWLHIGGITDTGDRRLVLAAGRVHMNGNLGIGTTSPVSQLHVHKDAKGALGPILTLMNNGGTAGAGAAIDFYGYDTLGKDPAARIQSIDDGQFSGHMVFLAKEPKSNNNTLKERVRISSVGNVGIGTNDPRTALDTGTGVMSGAANDYIKAQFTMSGGGTVTWGGLGGRLKWTNRFIAITMGNTPTVPAGHINIYMPTSDITAANVYDGKVRSVTAEGVVLNAWEALYAVHNVGGNQSDVSYRIVSYNNGFNAPSNWILVAVVNDDDKSIKLGTGLIVAARSSVAKGDGLPCGAIVMWSGKSDAIPDGWALCNGGSGTPDLRNRFVVGAGGGYGVADQGGQDTVTLSLAQIPSHNHNNGAYDRLMHIAGSEKTTYGGGGDVTEGEPCLVHVREIQAAGGNQPHENRPPYYALCYIMKIY